MRLRRAPPGDGGSVLRHDLVLLLTVRAALALASPTQLSGVAVFTAASQARVTDSLLIKGHAGDPHNWPMYGGDYGQTRFSPLANVNTSNVKRLSLVWAAHAGIVGPIEATPVVVGDALYMTTAMASGNTQHVVRFESHTGREVWRTTLVQDTAIHCCGPNNRGVALYGDKVFLGTIDASLVALNAADGRQVWRVSTADPSRAHSLTHAPVAFNGKVFVGSSGGQFSIRGFLKAFDVESGAEEWTWYSIPSPEEGGWWGEWMEVAPGTNLSLGRNIARERADSGRYATSWKYGGGAVWMTPSLDPTSGTLFVGVGNPTPGSPHPGDNRWTSSVCAIRETDGTMLWCYQYVPHDRWDYDAASPPFLFQSVVNDSSRRLVGHFSKLGFFYSWDLATGRLVTRSDSYVPQINLFGDASLKTVAPGTYGGVTWSPGAFNPGTGLVYATTSHLPTGWTQLEELWGALVAVNPASGRVAWQYQVKYPMIGGVLTTAGGLVFAGRTEGSFDAWNAATGELLWSFRTGVGCNAAPVTFLSRGRQYVVVACGGNYTLGRLGMTGFGDSILAFGLPD